MSRLLIGLTGGIASGKSEACRCFEHFGIRIADADGVARALVRRGQPALQAIAHRFGPDLLTADGELDRARMRALVFAEEAARRDLESILHPLIRQTLREACLAASGPYAIAAIPLLVEGGGRAAYPWLDRIVVVDVSRELQIRRLLERDGGSHEHAERILAAQATRQQRLAIADDVIPNDGTTDALARQVSKLHSVYLQLAAARK